MLIGNQCKFYFCYHCREHKKIIRSTLFGINNNSKQMLFVLYIYNTDKQEKVITMEMHICANVDLTVFQSLQESKLMVVNDINLSIVLDCGNLMAVVPRKEKSLAKS